MAVNAAVTLERPLLIKGEPGTGKTMLAEEVAQGLGKRLIQWHIKSTTKAQQGLYEYDASMSPYEIVYPGGSVEYMNPESGEAWMQQFRETYEKVIWINPAPEKQWQYTQSIGITKQLLEDKMYPLTLKGLEEGMTYLSK